jgi:hypothetical protein
MAIDQVTRPEIGRAGERMITDALMLYPPFFGLSSFDNPLLAAGPVTAQTWSKK